MNITLKRGFTCLGLAVAALLSASVSAAVITIDGSLTYQVIEGFGANINHRSWNTNELPRVLDALIDQAGMTLFRVIFDKTDWEAANDNGDPNIIDWGYYGSTNVYASPDFEKLWGIMAYLNRKGITDGLMPNFQGTGPDWMMGNGTLLPDEQIEAEWAEMVASAFIYARNTQHLQFTLIAPNNEQDNSSRDQGVNMTLNQYIGALDKLAQILDANGLSDLRFVGPDLAYTSTGWLSAMTSDPVIMAKLAHFGLHSYQDDADGSAGIYDLLQQSAYPDRTYWMTEFNVPCSSCNGLQGEGDSWDYASSAARFLLCHLAYGASAALVWEGYDSQYYYYDFPGGWSYWGLFAVDNINAVPRIYTPRKVFYTLAQFSRFIRPGARQIDLSPWATPPRAVAFYHPESGQLTLTGINPGSSAETLAGILTNLPPVAGLDLYYTDDTTNLCHGGTLPITNGAFTVTLPANCVFTLVGFDPARLAVSVSITNPPEGAIYFAPADISIQATATTTTGSLSRVEFFCGITSLGEAVTPPYDITWSKVPPGTYVLSAGASNSIGNTSRSLGVEITVVGPATQIIVAPSDAIVVPWGDQQFAVIAVDALGNRLPERPACNWSVSGGGRIDPAGLFAAGGSVGGPFIITANYNGISATASVAITTNLNLAPAGLGYAWYSLTKATDNSPLASAPGINDTDLITDVPLFAEGQWDTSDAYEAAGVIWATPQSVNRVVYSNGSYTTNNDGVFTAEFGLQFSADGAIWTNAGPAWSSTPAYVYDSPVSANAIFAFAAGVTKVRGVRCVGRVHTSGASGTSWAANATELQAFAAPVLPRPILTVSAASNGIRVSWPAPLTNYVLETADRLSGLTNWSPVTNAPQPGADLLTVTIPSPVAQRFFRLHQQ
jgi:O-glycosyl hydrolase